jgi:hypothetical protein
VEWVYARWLIVLTVLLVLVLAILVATPLPA